MAKITRHGGATDDVTGEGFSDDPNDDRAAGTRVAANTDEPAQVERFESVDDATAAQLEEGEQEHDGSDTALPPAENQDPDGEQMDAAPESPYAGWTKQNLQDEASRRGMSGAGTKAELVTRLDQDDQAGDPTQKA